MHHHPLLRRLVAPVIIVFLLAACTGGTDDRADAPPADREDQESLAGEVELAARQFRDPADDGYAPVEARVIRPDLNDWLGRSANGIPDQLAMVAHSPRDLIEAAAAALDSAEPADSILDSLGPLDGKLPGPVGRDGRRRNESGEPLTLDPGALDACGNAEISLSLAELGQDRALDHLVLAAEGVRASSLPSAQSWAEELEATVLRGTRSDLAPIVAFLAVCTAGGYEL